MATLGSTPSFSTWRFSDNGTSCAVAPDQVRTNSAYTLPTAGWITGIVVYVSGDGSSTTIFGCVWNGSNGLVINSAGTGIGSGSRSTNGQAWRTTSVGFFLGAGSVIFIGWMKPTGSTMVWSEAGASGGRWGYNGTVPGNYSDCGAVGGIGAYITYNPILAPSSTTSAASSVGSTTATLNGTVADGGQNGSGDPNSSHYQFQYGTDPALSTGTTLTALTAFNGTGQTAVQAITGLAVNTTYYFRVISTNDAGTVNGTILSFSTLGLPNAPTLTSPANNFPDPAQSASTTFAWTYNTGGAGGGETNYALKLTTGGVDSWWNGSSLQGTEIYVAEATTKTIPAGILSPSVTYLWTVSSQDANGKGPYAAALTLISEGPPSSPTLLAPISGIYQDMAGATPTFSWQYNAGNAVGGQSNFAIRRKISGGSTYSYFNVGTNSWQSTIVWNPGSAQSYTFSAGLWVDGNTYNWSIATQDAGGQSNFAADFTVTARAIPVVSVTAPTGSISTGKPVVVWSTSFPSGAAETIYQVRTFSAAQYGAGGFNPATSAAIDDSGAISSSSTTQYQVASSLPPGTSYRSYVQVIETGNLPSGFLAFGAFTVTTDLPPTPTLTAVATVDPLTGIPMIQLTAQSLINLLSSVDASFETGAGTYGATNCTIVQSSTVALDGSFSLRLTATAAATMFVGTGFYAVLPSTQYTALGSFRASTTVRNVQMLINWYDSTHTFLSQSSGSAIADTNSGWTQAFVTATAPANAAFAVVFGQVVTPAISEIHYLDEVGIFPGSGTTWSAGGFSATAGIILLRSDGVYVRGASTANPAPLTNTPSPDVAVINDYEITPLTAYTYQALLQATGAQGLVQSGYSPAAGASVSTNRWWQIDPTNPSSAVAAQPIAWNPSNTEQSAAHQVLGQSTMIVIASAMMGVDMTATIELFDQQTYSQFYSLLTSQKTIFFSDPFGFSYYFRIAPGPGGMSSGSGNKAHDTQLMASTAAAPHRTLNITGIAQPRPAV